MTRPLVVVLGASGYIGSAVTARLADRPIRLRVVTRRPDPVRVGGRARIEVCAADLTDPAGLAAAVADAEVIVHLVLYTGGKTWRAAGEADGERVNVGLVRDLVRVLGSAPRSRQAPIVLFAGSTSQPESGGVAPDNVYDRQKLAAERILAEATAQGVARGITLRLPMVFGHTAASGGGGGVLSAMVRRALAGTPLTMWHDGSVERDPLHVDDAARAFAAALDHADALAGRHWAVGSGRGRRVDGIFRGIAGLVAERTGRPAVPVLSVPPPGWATAADLRSVVVDTSPFTSVTGWSPRISLRDGLAHTVAALAAEPAPGGTGSHQPGLRHVKDPFPAGGAESLFLGHDLVRVIPGEE
ncbi:NAD-dependent epimerase/dehydratase family protein [Amycolatopsis alba]|uniref:NAD-dependent epimerase/dehydratase family protein n=1 Tax=Amycolatopsis alba TaxID=76020 RepID=UPI001FD80F9E|nr:NAD-dependent epimerase/dehydratase [Amycolatopsis alba]